MARVAFQRRKGLAGEQLLQKDRLHLPLLWSESVDLPLQLVEERAVWGFAPGQDRLLVVHQALGGGEQGLRFFRVQGQRQPGQGGAVAGVGRQLKTAAERIHGVAAASGESGVSPAQGRTRKAGQYPPIAPQSWS